MRTRTTTATLAVLLLAALTACSSSDDSSDDANSSEPTASASSEQRPTTTPDDSEADTGAAELKTAVEAYTEAYFAGEASTAYRMLSARCQKDVNELVYGATVDQAAKEYGAGHPATDVQADVSGDMARVTYKVEGLPKFDQSGQPWVREGDSWKYDAC